MTSSRSIGALASAALLASIAPAASGQYTTLYAFSGEAGEPHAPLIHSADGRLYGTTAKGCIDGVGSVYAMVPNGLGGYVHKVIGCFARTDTGHTPLGGVVEGADGALYGTASAGGPDGAGAVFRMTKTGQLSFIHVFDGADGREPHGELALASDGAFYGTTAFGGDNDYGTVFRVQTDGTFASLHSFAGDDGEQPMAGPIQASDGALYGTTYVSTSFGQGGTVYRITTGGALTTLYSFQYPFEYPQGRLTQLADSKLYGTTSAGSVIFRIGLDGNGWEQVGSTIPSSISAIEQGADGLLYGTGQDAVFRMDPTNGRGDYIHLFDGMEGKCSTLIEMSDYGFIGTCPGVGDFGEGFVFRVYPWQQYEVLHDFPVAPEGHSPQGTLADGADGSLYGVTSPLSVRSGTIFQVGMRGGLRVLRRFSAADGQRPTGGLTAGPDGAFYGVTSWAGANGVGTAFRVESGGAFAVLHDFTQAEGTPAAALAPASDGAWLGVTTAYSPSTQASIYRLHDDGQLDPLYAFVFQPSGPGRLLEASDGGILGTAADTPASPFGSAYRWDSLNGFLSIHNFSGSPPEGYRPQAGLIEPSPGSLFGTTYWGGASGVGTIYRMDSDGATTPLHDLLEADGGLPASELLAASDGKLYGVASGYGANGLGTIFRIDGLGNFEKLHDFASDEGATPLGPLLRGADGAFYGTLSEGGARGNGAVFRFAVSDLLSIGGLTPDSGPAAGGTAVVIGGTSFHAGATVSIGGVGVSANVDDTQHISMTSPAAAPGSVGAAVVSNSGGDTVTLQDGWFADFLDVDGAHPFHDFVESIVRAGITAGCGGGNYCPGAPVTRAQMAVFLLKAEHGAAYAPPACSGTFADVPCPGPFTDWIERLAAEGVTGGCGGGNYCPASPVTRAQMAVFLLKTLLGAAYVPPAALGVFGDVPPGSFAADWIEDLYARQITGGCSASPLLYCPGASNTRGQMAVFLTKTFSLP